MAITDSGLGLLNGAGNFYDYVLRNHFLPEVADGINHDYVLLKRFEAMADSSMVEGKNVVHPVHTGRNVTGVGAVGYSTAGARGKLPDPKAQQYNQYQYPIRHVYGRVLIDAIAQDASQTDIDSWLRALESEMAGLRDDLAREENRMLHNDGSGVLGYTASFGDTTSTVVLSDLVESPTTMTGMDASYWFDVGGRYAAIVASSGAIAKEVVITSKTASTITYAASTASAVKHYFVKANTGTNGSLTSVESTGLGREPMGIGGIFSDADVQGTTALPGAYSGESALANTFQGIASSGNVFNQCTVLANGAVNRTLTEAVLQNAWSRAEKALQAKISAIISSFGVRDAFADLLLTYRRQVNKMELAGGFTTVEYNGVPFIADRDTYPNRAYLMDESEFRQHCMGSKQYRFRDEQGTIYLSLPDEHAFQVTLYRRFTYGVMARARQTLLTDLIEL